MGSNSNPEGFGRSGSSSFDMWIDQTTDTSALIWSGNLTLVKEAYERSSAGSVLLESRLDADDGLHHRFIESVQLDARKNLLNTNQPNENWRLFCIDSRIEWHPLNPYPETANKSVPLEEGYLVLYV